MSFDLSLCMIIRNEESCLERSLSSASGIVSEMIVVDTGSTDNSREIAKAFGATVIPVSWEYDFARARNAGIQCATKKWILVLDADEELEKPNLEYLDRLLRQDDVYGYFIKMINFIGEPSDGEYVTDSVCRLFRNHPEIRFANSIHEEAATSILKIPGARLEYSEVTVRHYGYLTEAVQKKNKNERNMEMIQEAIKRKPDDLQLQYALGTEHFQRGHYAEALKVFQALLPRTPVFSGYDSDLMLKTAFALREAGRKQESLKLVEEALIFYPDFTDLLELKAILLIDSETCQDALSVLSDTIEIGDVSYKYTSSSGSGTYRALYLAGLSCEYLYLWKEAKDYYYKALLRHPGYLPVWKRLPIISFSIKEIDELLAFVESHRSQIPKIAWNLLVQTAINGRDPDLALRILSRREIDALSDPILEGVLLSQMNDDQHARMVWSSYQKPLCHLYLWALELKGSDTVAAMRQLEKLAIADTAFASIEAILKGEEIVNISEVAFRRCQQALLHTGAWDGFLWFQNRTSSAAPRPWLPVHLHYGLLQAPSPVKYQLLKLCKQKQSNLTYPEMLAAGIFAFDCGDHEATFYWFSECRAKFPKKIAPLIGLLHFYWEKSKTYKSTSFGSASNPYLLVLCE